MNGKPLSQRNKTTRGILHQIVEKNQREIVKSGAPAGEQERAAAPSDLLPGELALEEVAHLRHLGGRQQAA